MRKDYLYNLHDLKITNNKDLAKAKKGIKSLNITIRKARSEQEKPFNYEIMLYIRDRLNKMVKGYESLKNNNFRLETLNKYISKYHLDKNEQLTLCNTLFNY